MSQKSCAGASWFVLFASGVSVLAWSAPADAQTVGTFTWQLQPYCNVVTFAVSVDGPAYRLTGYDDGCGDVDRIPAAGTVMPNGDGTFSFSFYSVTPDGRASHVTSTLSPGVFSGPWIDSGGQTGNFAFGVPSPQAGMPRPTLCYSRHRPSRPARSERRT